MQKIQKTGQISEERKCEQWFYLGEYIWQAFGRCKIGTLVWDKLSYGEKVQGEMVFLNNFKAFEWE